MSLHTNVLQFVVPSKGLIEYNLFVGTQQFWPFSIADAVHGSVYVAFYVKGWQLIYVITLITSCWMLSAAVLTGNKVSQDSIFGHSPLPSTT